MRHSGCWGYQRHWEELSHTSTSNSATAFSQFSCLAYLWLCPPVTFNLPGKLCRAGTWPHQASLCNIQHRHSVPRFEVVWEREGVAHSCCKKTETWKIKGGGNQSKVWWVELKPARELPGQWGNSQQPGGWGKLSPLYHDCSLLGVVALWLHSLISC